MSSYRCERTKVDTFIVTKHLCTSTHPITFKEPTHCPTALLILIVCIHQRHLLVFAVIRISVRLD